MLMSRFILTLTMAWSVVAAPTLCRAGVLVSCCDHDVDPATANATADCTPTDGCCPNPEPVNAPADRGCSACVSACQAVAKPSDELNPTFDLHAITVAVDSASSPMADAAFAGFTWSVDRSDPPGLPFPRSDIPLLI
jgi:hypothetical protein